MAVSNTPFLISKKSQAGVIAFMQQAMNMVNQQWNIRQAMRQIDLRYMRELDYTEQQQKAKLANSYGDANRIQNLTIPVVMPAVESAVTYQTSVFLTGTPIFDVVGDPNSEDAAMAMAAVIDENSIRGGWIRELQMFFRDGFKYNLSASEVVWDRKITYDIPENYGVTEASTKQLKQIVWQGNSVRRWDPYNTFWDSRLPITEVSEDGEFAGHVQLMSRIGLKKFIAQLTSVTNAAEAFASGYAGGAVTESIAGRFYVPPLNSKINYINPIIGTDWMAWANASEATKNGKITIDYKNLYEVMTIYARIMPIDFNILAPGAATPQVWKFIIVNAAVVIFAERQTNAHERIPVLFGQPLEDGLTYQTKSMAENVSPIQDITTAITNSVMDSRRRAVSDRGLYDPSRVSEKNINSPVPSAKIPVKPAAYGKPLGEAYYPIPFEDRDSVQILQMIPMLAKFSDVVTGQNPARQGQFVKGNKTKTEYADVMNNSNGRDQTYSILYEAQIFTPMKEMIKLNVLQYQAAGTVYYRGQQRNVKIDPVALRKATLSFKVSDGLTPTSKLISADSFTAALQTIGSSPTLAQAYNIGPMFSYLMKTQSADIREFEKPPEQLAYEQAMGQWQQMAQLAIENKQQFNTPQPQPAAYGYLVNGQLKQSNPQDSDALNSFLQNTANTVAQAEQGQGGGQ